MTGTGVAIDVAPNISTSTSADFDTSSAVLKSFTRRLDYVTRKCQSLRRVSMAGIDLKKDLELHH